MAVSYPCSQSLWSVLGNERTATAGAQCICQSRGVCGQGRLGPLKLENVPEMVSLLRPCLREAILAIGLRS
jgi:hypothetical protein